MMTKTLDDYMNDPEIVNEPMPLREIYAIRLRISDETKDMTPEERIAYRTKRLELVRAKRDLPSA